MRWTGSPFRIRSHVVAGISGIRNGHVAHRCRHVVPGMLSLLPIAIQHEAEPRLEMNTVAEYAYLGFAAQKMFRHHSSPRSQARTWEPESTTCGVRREISFLQFVCRAKDRNGHYYVRQRCSNFGHLVDRGCYRNATLTITVSQSIEGIASMAKTYIQLRANAH